MQSILQACTPRDDILAGTFNPEIFTASISLMLSPTASEDAPFWPELKGLEQLIQDRDQLMMRDINLDILREIEPHLLFDINVPRVGQKGTVTVPISLAECALDVSCRVADGMRMRKTELSVGALRNRIAREIEKQSKRANVY